MKAETNTIDVIVLGASGMLGHEVARTLSQNKKINLCVTVRTHTQKKKLQKLIPGKVHFVIFDAEKEIHSLERLIKKGSFIVNCIGLIKPHIQENQSTSIEKAIRINSLFPCILSQSAARKAAKVLQIATDCVYDGREGNYTEKSIHNAGDVYGKTKSLGEVTAVNFFNIRTSIIGFELFNKLSLLEWFLGQKKSTEVNGFTNHYWNGVTTYHFAKIVEGIIVHNIKLPTLIHLTPRDTVSKYELLAYFRKYFRPDMKVKKAKAAVGVNRILGTDYATINAKLWRMAGYKKSPTIEELIKEISK